MTSPPSSPRSSARASAQLRAIGLWALSLALTLAFAALLAWAGVLLAIFGLAGVALAVAAAMTAIGLTVWRRGMLPMAILSAALVLPATAVSLGETRFERSVGLLTVRPERVADLDQSTTYRRGSGTVFVDLRKLRPTPGSTLRVKARADNGPVVVALPHDVCLQTRIRYRVDRPSGNFAELAHTSLNAVGVDSGNPGDVSWNSMGMSVRDGNAENRLANDAPAAVRDGYYELLAYGRNPVEGVVPIDDGRLEWTRIAAEPNAARLELDVDAAAQIVVRDFPDWAAPLSDGSRDGYEQVSDATWPRGVRAPLSPGNRSWRLDAGVRTAENRARWVTWEREMLEWGQQQAERFAGPCATQRELQRRAVAFWTQPAAVRQKDGSVSRIVGGPTTRTSPIAQGVFPRNTIDLYAQVDGLGHAKPIGYDRRSHGGFTNAGLEEGR